MKIIRNPIVLLVLLFGSTLFIRSAYFNKPLSEHHEWLTAHTLVTLQIWEKEGIANHHFAPIYSFPGTANKYIAALGGIETKEGNCYYISYPPFGFLLPYFLFQTFQLPATPFWLELFNLLLHLIGTIILFLIVYEFIVKKASTPTSYPFEAMIAVVIYLFSAASLWFLCNVYFLDMLAQLEVLLVIYCWLKHFQNPSRSNTILLLVSFFLLCFTEWIGILLGFTLFLDALVFRKKKWTYPLLSGLLVSGLAALALMIYLYASIAGWEAFKTALLSKYLSRSGWSNERAEGSMSLFSKAAFLNIMQHYKVNFAPVLKWLFLLLLLVLAIKVRSKQTLRQFFSHSEASILCLFFVPLILHHALLFNFTAIHDFSTAKAAAPLGILAAILFQKLRNAQTYQWPMVLLFGMVSAYFWGRSIEQYYIMNKATYDTNYFQKVGLCIQKQSEAKEVIVLKQGTIYVSSGAPQFMYYSQRNALGYWSDTILTNELTKKRNQATAIIFDIPWQNGIVADSILTRKLK